MTGSWPQWRILSNPTGALDCWPELAAEFGRRWAAREWDHAATVIDHIRAADHLALEILRAADVIPATQEAS